MAQPIDLTMTITINGMCSTCKYWKPIPEKMKVGGWGSCKITESDGEIAKIPTSKAVAVDAESYWAELRTLPDFGCNQWEPNNT